MKTKNTTQGGYEVGQNDRWPLPTELPLADEQLPPVIRELVSIAPANRKIHSLIACLAPLAMLSTRVRFWVDAETRKKDAILLQVILEGEAGIGKSFVADIERTIMHDVVDLRDKKQREAEQEYRERKSAAGDNPIAPPPKAIILQIPPSTSKNEIVKHAGMFERVLGAPLTMWLFSEELATMVDATKTGYSDLHTVLRVAYDLNSKYGQDFASYNSYTGIVHVMICMMFTTTPIDTDNFMTRESVSGGNSNRLIFCPIKDPPGARPAKFKRLTDQQQQTISAMVKQMFDNILNEQQEVQPEWELDLSWLNDDIEQWIEESCLKVEQMYKLCDPYYRALDSFRKRASKNAERCAALCYYLYQLELGREAASSETIRGHCRTLYRFLTRYILNALMERWADDYIEYYVKRERGARVGKKYSLYEQMPDTFTREELKMHIERIGYRTDARFMIAQWKEAGRICEVAKFVYTKCKEESGKRKE